MKYDEKKQAIALRHGGQSIKDIASKLNVAVSSVSVWVRDVPLSHLQRTTLKSNSFSSSAVEKRRASRLTNESAKRNLVIAKSAAEIRNLTLHDIWLMGTMLYWAEGGKTQRMVRFSNGDPNMHKLMMQFFRLVCTVNESKLRGYIHIHDHLDFEAAELYWADITNIPPSQFFKTYRKLNSIQTSKKDTLPYGVLDVYVLDTNLFLQISGWAKGIFTQAERSGVIQNIDF